MGHGTAVYNRKRRPQPSAAQVPRRPLTARRLGVDRDVRARELPRPHVLGKPHGPTERRADPPIVPVRMAI